MRDEYWKFFYVTSFNSEYFNLVYNSSRKINNVLETLPYIISTASVAAWAIWENYPLLWAFIVAACQIISLCKERFPWYQRKITLKYTLPRLRELVTELECFWSEIEHSDVNDDMILQKLQDFRKKSAEIANALVEMNFDEQKRTREIAIENNAAYFSALYGV